MRRPRSAAATNRAVPGDGSRLVWGALVAQQARLRSTAARLATVRGSDVHDARVAARRLRSLLSTYRTLLDDRRSRHLRGRLRDFARALSGVREADVRRELLLELAGLEPPIAAADVGRLRAMLRWSSAESRRVLRGLVGTKGWSESVANLADERTLTALRMRPGTGLAEVLDLVDRPWHDADELLKARPRNAAMLHRLRLALKRCRYALESVASLQPERAEQVLGHLRSAQDSLGEHRDAAQARIWLRANEQRLGRPLARRLGKELKLRGRDLKAQGIERAASVLPAYAEWREGTRSLRKAPETSRGPALPGPGRRSRARSLR
jgi:CHAD domain-containing protein